MAQRALDLACEQIAVVPEVALERVLVEDDLVLETVTGHAVPEVLAVGPVLAAELRDDDGDRLQQPLQLLRQGVDRVCDQRLELARALVFRHRANGRVILSENPPLGEQMSDSELGNTKLRRLSAALAIFAIFVGGVAWSGCGSDDNANDDTNQAQQEAEQGADEAREGIEEGADEAKQGLEDAREKVEEGDVGEGVSEAEKQLEESRDDAEKGIEEAKEQAERYLP